MEEFTYKGDATKNEKGKRYAIYYFYVLFQETTQAFLCDTALKTTATMENRV